MFNETYDDYIRSILGISTNNNYIMEQEENPYNRQFDMSYRQSNYNQELEQCYPEIYKIIYPMITKRCQNIATPVTRDMVEEMTEEIYTAIEEKEIRININLKNSVTKTTTSATQKPETRVDVRAKEENNQRETRQQNTGLRDLIKILILRELLGRPGFPNPRPPRPPFSGPRPPRPPMRPRDFGMNYNSIYEQPF